MFEIAKRFYIGEVAKLIGVHPGTLKNWERDSLIPRAHRTDGLIKKRWWTEEEVKQILEFKRVNYRW